MDLDTQKMAGRIESAIAKDLEDGKVAKCLQINRGPESTQIVLTICHRKDAEKLYFEANCDAFELKPSDYGATFRYKEDLCTIVGLAGLGKLTQAACVRAQCHKGKNFLTYYMKPELVRPLLARLCQCNICGSAMQKGEPMGGPWERYQNLLTWGVLVVDKDQTYCSQCFERRNWLFIKNKFVS